MKVPVALLEKYPFLKSETFIQASKYAVVGGFCTVLDFATLFILTHVAGINYLTSSIFSFMLGTVLNYFLCTYWIFKLRVVENKKTEFVFYLAITAIGLMINTALIWSFTEFFELYFMVSKLLATFVTVWWNFFARKYFLHTIK